MQDKTIDELLKSEKTHVEVIVRGWVRSFRSNRFIALNDGSTIKTLQCVVDFENFEEEVLKKVTVGAAIEVKGALVESQGQGQTLEIQVSKLTVLGEANPEEVKLTILSPKRHSLETLREQAHLRIRTNTFGAVMRTRSKLAFAVHEYFQKNGFNYMHSPIITGSDAEGAGEMFRVTNLDAKSPPLKNDEINLWGERFYDEIVNCIIDTKSIDNKINKQVPGYNLKRIVLASPAEINNLLSQSLNKNNILNDLFRGLYKNLKHKLFCIDNKGGRPFLKEWLSNELIKDKTLNVPYSKKRFQLAFEKTIKDYGYLFSLSIYNIKRVSDYNHLSIQSYLDFSKDFFEKETNLTVSGQLEAETYAMALGKVYTFGPTFRAENSNTSRHLAEFWMIEPEVAFNDLDANMDLAEDFIKYVVNYALENCADDLEFLENRLLEEEKNKPQDERSEMKLREKLRFILENNFKRVSYTEAIDILKRSKPNQKKKFKYIIEEWGADLQSEHERFLVEKHFKCPVILFDYPANIKSFYMRLNDDGKTVRAMDVLFPGIGEIVGGSQREERYDVLLEKMKTMNVDAKELYWYLDLRKFGTAVHSGFGLGFERLVQFTTGMGNIRDVIPYPRTPGNAEF